MNLRSSLRTLAFTGACALAAVWMPQVSSAAVVYDPAGPGIATNSGMVAVAIRFNTGAGTALESFFVPATFSNSTPKAVGFALFSDASSAPGTLLASFNETFHSSVSNINATNSYLSTLPGSTLSVIQNLSPNTNYWLALSFAAFSVTEVQLQAHASDPGGTGSPFAQAVDFGPGWSPMPTVIDATISTNGGAPSGVPETASVSVWGAAAGLMALAHRLRRKGRTTP